MENAVEALKMAGSVLLFVLALSIAMLSFSNVRQAIDTVLKYTDREGLTASLSEKALKERFYYLSEDDNSARTRYVGKETIIPTIFRSKEESFKIIFDFPDDYYLYKDSNGVEVKKIGGTEEEGIADVEDFYNGIVYRNMEF